MYEKLDVDKQEIRLLTIAPGQRGSQLVCDLSHASLTDETLKFEALSYCWGSDQSRMEISLSGNLKKVTANLHSALQHLRFGSEARVLWVDAICINQDDNTERAQQVGLMQTVYSTCDKVLIWLGEESDDSTLALDALGSLSFLFEYVMPGGSTEAAIWKLVTRPWFHRVWVIQEMALAKAGTIMVGDAELPLERLEQSIVEVLGTTSQPRPIKQSGKPLLPQYFDAIVRYIKTRREAHQLERTGRGLGCPLPNVLDHHSDAQATDPRDNVFAFVGIAEPIGGPDLVISYDLSVQEVYANLVKRWISHHLQLDIITLFMERQQRRLDLPSWMPDFSGRSQQDFMNWPPSSPFNREGPFAAWTGRDKQDGCFTTSVRNSGHPQWYVERPSEDTDEMGWIRDPRYSRFLTLDGCQIDSISESYHTSSVIDDALEDMTSLFPLQEIDLDEGSRGLRLLEHSERLREHRNAAWKPWTRLFASMEPGDLEDGSYVTGEHKLTAYITTLLAGGHRVDQVNLADKSESHFSESLNPATENNLMALLKTRRFTVTARGLYALVPKNAQAGDVIAVLVGGVVPFVLRKKKWTALDLGTKASSTPGGEPNAQRPHENPQYLSEEYNGPKYAGTSRGPDFPLLI